MEDSRAATASETDPGEGDQIPHDDPLQWHSSGAGRRSHARDLTLVTGNGRLWRGQAGVQSPIGRLHRPAILCHRGTVLAAVSPMRHTANTPTQ